MRNVQMLLWLAALPSAEDAVEGKFVLIDPPKALPDVRFVDGDGRHRALSDFHGKFVLLNIWATWCIPCRKEIPTLDRLQSALGGDGFEVVALSIDRGGLDIVRKFYREIRVSHLATYVDASGGAFRDLAIVGLPTTLLIDRAGREIGHLVGPAEWDAPDTIALLRRLIGRPAGALAPPIGVRVAVSDDPKGARSLVTPLRRCCSRADQTPRTQR